MELRHGSGEAASTGIPELDGALGGIYWGDNVVWEAHGEVTVAPFYEAVAALRPAYDVAAYATLTADGEAVQTAYPGFEVLDARPGSDLHRPGALLEAIVKRCDRHGRNLLLFDALGAMVASWGAETAARFFARCCPLLLDVGAVAYWSLSASDVPPPVRRTVEQVTQCMLAVSDDRLRVSKAEGRAPAAVGRVFRWRLEDGRAVLSPAPAAARIGAALRQLRSERGMSQAELARVAGISPSAISQAERGARGLSLETLLELTATLNITLDELLHGEVSAGYRLGRLGSAPDARAGRAAPSALLDDPKLGLRAYAVHLESQGSASPHVAHKGIELVAVARGLVQVVLSAGTPVLRQGDVLLIERERVLSWRNLARSDSLLFWILRDRVVT